MRDPNLMLALLKEMAEAEDESGSIIVPLFTAGSDKETARRRHHAELLTDEGLALWDSDPIVRITNRGYDFLNAIDQGPRYRKRFVELIQGGTKIATAVKTVIELVEKVQ